MMKVRTSITLTAATLRAVDALATGAGSNRSRVIEEAVRDYLRRRQRTERDRRELAVLNRAADELNREVEDALAFQADT